MRTHLGTLPALALAALLLGSACKGGGYTYEGQKLSDYFPLYGEPHWEYALDGDAEGKQMTVDKNPVTQKDGDRELVTLDYALSKPSVQLLTSIVWSSDSSDGVLVHSMTDQLTGTTTTYDPPVIVAEATMTVDDVIETETGGSTFSTTYVGQEDCPNLWVTDTDEDVWECVHIKVDDGDGDPNSGPLFAADWWWAADWGTSRFLARGNSGQWILLDADPIIDD
jgi:hypothetical protein